ncbi:unnamed protein product [Sphenostylis stenocarpa]|uniref:non-specific serine/threonine protein kinase n=1 Tax=Sphenostylis stenocarpa TaxID=92480 RepID=A0AA86VS14_9FABA|nr:unnamed protein product [Sphenostylis stenocarpa]
MEPNLGYSRMFFLLLLASSSFIFLSHLASAATPKLNTREVNALKEIGSKIRKKDWDFGVDPCSGKGNWNVSDDRKGFETSVISLKAQNLSGSLSPEFSKLHYLTQLDLSRNVITGSIPRQWATMRLVEISLMGNRLSGPFPQVLTNITTLRNLRISDNNFFGKIPDFISNWTVIEKLHMHGCSLEGPIPSSISALTSLSDLDLSYNDLSGEIPESFAELDKVDFMYLTGNKLSGVIPGWVLGNNKNINLVESYSSSVNTQNKIHSCLKRNFPCPASASQYQYALNINCGGKEANVSGHIYEADSERKGAAMLYYTSQDWALSSTGNFMDNDIDSDPYTVTNTSRLNVSALNSQLYTTARVSPLALTYYGLCLINGNYTIKLHFAEIIFINDRSLNSLGKRGNLVLKDLDIQREAGGTGKPIVKTFNATVTQHTLKIHFYWAGKGTTGIPTRGVYGPLVSAISGWQQNLCHTGNWHSRWCFGSSTSGAGFHEVDGMVRRKRSSGLLSDGTIIAVKQLSSKSKQGNREFVNEMGLISGLQHPNLVKLYGCCVEGNQLILIYEYMENNCLSRVLFGRNPENRIKLDWPTRKKICLGIAKALAYLHEESRIKIIHRDIKASNVLLDKDFNAKVSDFGLAKLIEDDKTHISTRVAGTIGYMAPEYAMRGYLTDKADVYSFGVVALETVSGKSNTNFRPNEDFVYLLDWAYVLQERGSLLELVDPDLGSEYSTEEAMVVLNVALLCTNASPTLRPTMSQAVSMLEGWTDIQDLLSDPGYSAVSSSSKYKSIRNHFWQNPSRTHSMSIPSVYTDSSGSHVETEKSYQLVTVNSDGSDKGN